MKTTPETSPSSILDGIYVEKTPHHGFEWRFPTKGLSQSMSMGEVMLWSILQELKHPMMVINAKTPHNRPCPKCGSGDISRHAYLKGEEWQDWKPRQRKSGFVVIGDYSTKAKVDCIQHKCRCCQWVWETAPLPENVTAHPVRTGGATPPAE